MNPLAATGVTVVAFVLLWIANGWLRVPREYVPVGSAIAAFVFLSLPVMGIYFSTMLRWRFATAALGVLLGLLTVALLRNANDATGFVSAVMQVARIAWPLCLGVLVAGLVKDRNLLLPIAIVLATVDILAVLAPSGTVKQGLQSQTIRPIFDALAFQVPKLGTITPAAQMGPADPLFLGMFFTALHRFKMRALQTLLWVLPTLCLYLLIVIRFGHTELYGIKLGALPALVPIGLVMILVNWREFRMSVSERVMLMFVLLGCLAAIVYAFRLSH